MGAEQQTEIDIFTPEYTRDEVTWRSVLERRRQEEFAAMGIDNSILTLCRPWKVLEPVLV